MNQLFILDLILSLCDSHNDLVPILSVFRLWSVGDAPHSTISLILKLVMLLGEAVLQAQSIEQSVGHLRNTPPQPSIPRHSAPIVRRYPVPLRYSLVTP